MSERCPLLSYEYGLPFVDEKIPDFCREHCEDLWDDAVRKLDFDGAYDTYRSDFYDECSSHGADGFSHDGLTATSETKRSYAIVDLCSNCELEYGEQDYKFNCPKV